LDPFHGYKNATDDELEDAVAVLDAFHVVKLATGAVDDVATGASNTTSTDTADAKTTRCSGSATSCTRARRT
jgi:transposase